MMDKILEKIKFKDAELKNFKPVVDVSKLPEEYRNNPHLLYGTYSRKHVKDIYGRGVDQYDPLKQNQVGAKNQFYSWQVYAGSGYKQTLSRLRMRPFHGARFSQNAVHLENLNPGSHPVEEIVEVYELP